MKWQELVNDGFSRVTDVLEPALEGISQKILNRRPKDDVNSMGWIVWHLTRIQDVQIADLAGEEQIWVKEKWYLKFKRPVDTDDTGYGHTAEQVAAFKSPSPDVLLGYYRATMAQTRRYISALKLSDLDRKIDEDWYEPPPTVGVRIISIMADCLQHSGEVGYVLGLLTGKGWLGY
jgi:hypothetical protein